MGWLMLRVYQCIANACWLILAEWDGFFPEQVHLSVVEIYCESIKDLLSDGPGSTNLAVQQDKELGIIIAGAARVCPRDLAGCCNHLPPHCGFSDSSLTATLIALGLCLVSAICEVLARQQHVHKTSI